MNKYTVQGRMLGERAANAWYESESFLFEGRDFQDARRRAFERYEEVSQRFQREEFRIVLFKGTVIHSDELPGF